MNSWLRKWGEQFIRSRQYAAGFALIVSFISFFDMPIGLISTIIIGLVTLQNGARQGLIVAAWAMLPAAAMMYLGQYALFIDIVILHYLIVWSFAVVLRKYNSWMNVLQLGSCLGILAVIAIHFFAPDLQTWLTGQLLAVAKEYKNTSLSLGVNPAEFDASIKYLGLIAIGMFVLATILTNLVTLLLARLWQSMIVPSISMQKECLTIRMHYLTSLLLIGLGMGLYADNSLFINVLVVALMPCLVAGLSLLHALAATKKNGNVVMFVFYILFLFLSPCVALFLTVMGWLDSFLNFRKKFVVSDSALEE